MVTPAAFNLTVKTHSVPPRVLDAPLAALWWAKKGEWEKAHRLVQDEATSEAAWVHAYLHRVERPRQRAILVRQGTQAHREWRARQGMGGHHRHAAETLASLIRALRNRWKIRVVLDDLLAAEFTAADDEKRRREGDDSAHDQAESAVLSPHVFSFA